MWLCVWNENTNRTSIPSFRISCPGQRDNQCPLPNVLAVYWAGLYQVSIISWFCGIESPSLFERGGAVFWVMVMVTDMDSVSVKGSNLLAWGR